MIKISIIEKKDELEQYGGQWCNILVTKDGRSFKGNDNFKSEFRAFVYAMQREEWLGAQVKTRRGLIARCGTRIRAHEYAYQIQMPVEG